MRSSQERLDGGAELVGLVAREVVKGVPEADLADDLQRRAAHPREHVDLSDAAATTGAYPLGNRVAGLGDTASELPWSSPTMQGSTDLVRHAVEQGYHLAEMLRREHRVDHLALPSVLLS